jgi:hypothetical protein
MTRGLTSGQISYLENNATINETLIQISYNGNSVYYTTGLSDISATTDFTDGAKTFVTNPYVENIDNLPEVPFGNENRAAVLFTGNMGTTISALGVSPLEFVNVDTKFYIHRIYRTLSDYSLWTEDPISLYTGFLVKKTYNVGATFERLQLELMNRHRIRTVSPLFADRSKG